MYTHKVSDRSFSKNKVIKIILVILLVLGILAAGYGVYSVFLDAETVEESIEARLTYDASLTIDEQNKIAQSIADNAIIVDQPITAKATTSSSLNTPNHLLDAYVPITHIYSVRQNINTEEFSGISSVAFHSDTDPIVIQAISDLYDIQVEQIISFTDLEEIDENTIAFVNEDILSYNVKLLSLDEEYFLDTLNSGAIFREVVFEGEGAYLLADMNLSVSYQLSDVLKVNMSGVTALTREMQRKLLQVKDPLYFSAKIGDFLADADITHVSNEVSFAPNCPYSYTAFCSPPEFIETLKASGVDLVELTGNHNNDLGSEFNTETINLYKELGWATIGGGLNSEEAAKPYILELDGSTVAFLAYNYPDSPNGGAIAGANRAGANPFDFSYSSIEQDILAAKESADFVIVDVQYWECYSYPNGYVEFPICDKPIDGQEETFKKLIDLGADMVIGSSAHQPQTYELYNDKPIYYGLGNLYFEQTQWPGTERGIILTHYFKSGELLQTKLTPTVYDRDLQTRIMTDDEAAYLLTRLRDARE